MTFSLVSEFSFFLIIIFNCGKIHIKFTIFSVQFSGIKYIHIVQPLPPLISRTLSSCKTDESTWEYSWNTNSPFPSPSSPWQPPFYFLSLCIWLFKLPHISAILQCLSFCDWLISLSIMSLRFIHVEHVSEFPSFLRLNHILLHVYTTFCLSIHLSVTYVASTF